MMSEVQYDIYLHSGETALLCIASQLGRHSAGPHWEEGSRDGCHQMPFNAHKCVCRFVLLPRDGLTKLEAIQHPQAS